MSYDDGNFYLHSSLPQTASPLELYRELATPPTWDSSETTLPPPVRRSLVVRRLSKYFLPGVRQLRLFEEFIGFVRSGYEGRGQTNADHERRIREVAGQHQDGSLICAGSSPKIIMTGKKIGLNNTARSAVLIGMPGMGKSLTIEEILNRFPEVIEHISPFYLKQIVWMKLDCPHKVQ